MLEIHSQASVYSAFKAVAEAHLERAYQLVVNETAERYGIAAGILTYADALARVEQLVERYGSAGVCSGHRVMLALDNRPEFFLQFFALNALGAGVVPVNPDLRHAELTYMIGHAEPVLAVAVDDYVERLIEAAKAAEVVMPVIGCDEVIPEFRRAPPRDRAEPLRREAAMLYTSGTTGRPKGCVLSNLYFLHAGEWYRKTGGLCELRDGERMITPLPLFHMNAMACSSMAMLSVGGCLTNLDRFHPSSWWDSVRESGATCLHYLGVMPSILMAAQESPDDQAHQIRFGFGAGVVRELHAPFEARFGFPLVEAWAMTETGVGAVVCANRLPRKVGQSVLGRPEDDVEVRIITDEGHEAEPDEPGELLVRHGGEDPKFGFFTEYYRDPDATAAAWEGGWFHTGDVVKRDVDGDMVFVDRKKNVIRRSGENIAAVEVESVLMAHSAVNNVAVAAVPDEIRGDEVFACIVPAAEPSKELADEIVSWCLTQLAYYKAPAYVSFVDALPLTSTQKIQRGELKALCADKLTKGEFVDTSSHKVRQKS